MSHAFSPQQKAPPGPGADRGSALAIIVVLMAALLGFLGVAIYTGLNAYLQNELQNAVSSSAGAGATAMYSEFDGNGRPVKSPGIAQTAAQSTFNDIVSANPSLGSFNARLVNGTPTVNAGNDTVTVNARADVPTPFLAPIGITQYNVDANATARYARMELEGGQFTINTKNGPYFRIVTVDPPVVDSPGPDIFIESSVRAPAGGLHGYIVELCSAGKCYDIGRAARAANGGSVITDRPYPGYGARRVLYGSFYIDLGAQTGSLYNRDVVKGAAIRIVDDGIHDYLDPGSGRRGIELDPAPTTLDNVQLYHYAVFCADQNICTLPPGFEFGI